MSKKVSEIGFVGEVHAAACACHIGQWVVLVWVLHPIHGRQQVGHKMFPTQDQATDQMAATVIEIAKAIIEPTGLKISGAINMTVAHQGEADKQEERFMMRNVHDLH